MKTKKKEMYVDNVELNRVMTEYIRNLKENPDTKIPEYIGHSIMMIANRLSTRGNFNRYTFRDEMISDGILDAVKGCKNYNPERFSNPFAYFTQIVYYAFIRRIQSEKLKFNTMKDYIKQLDPEDLGEDVESMEILEAIKSDIEQYERDHS